MANKLPCAVIVSSSNTKPISVIKLITGDTTLNISSEETLFQPWSINTKYYTADINLCALPHGYERSDELNNSVEAVIVHFDSNSSDGLADLDRWNHLLEDCDPEIKLLISNYCNSNTKVTRSKAQEWCLKRGFELIELYPTEVEESDDDIIKETTGAARIVEALETHTWSNLVLKDKEKPEVSGAEVFENSNIEKMLDNMFLDDGPSDFNQLFQQLSDMRESVQALPIRERRQCAEQVVTAFWRAIGGDEEEIADT